ncbi:hypothetical protein E2C01_069135 [Portunus trituberculatus]|uniref:Uncharacterized protein n=1 Tax=Portunus trituberculatus TaxID=210409 RepID=A0A5B7HQN1_PORTR|nr:hypothetical protein [Portunus trituberculatus]
MLQAVYSIRGRTIFIRYSPQPFITVPVLIIIRSWTAAGYRGLSAPPTFSYVLIMACISFRKVGRHQGGDYGGPTTGYGVSDPNLSPSLPPFLALPSTASPPPATPLSSPSPPPTMSAVRNTAAVPAFFLARYIPHRYASLHHSSLLSPQQPHYRVHSTTSSPDW